MTLNLKTWDDISEGEWWCLNGSCLSEECDHWSCFACITELKKRLPNFWFGFSIDTFDFFFFFLMLLWTFSKMRTRWSRCGGDQGLKGQEWVLGSVVYHGAHCISEERVGALHLIRQRLLTSEWWSWRNADITHGSFGSFLIASSWSQAHCFNPLFCTALSHSFHSIKVYENCYLDL